ncbi:hypothetical protein IQ229_14540 [Nostoc cf. edaphicum LEGE 07299]|uniref:Uncharacterized protein n=1 Tax=Nostoc cf. edaphicum LEGE 07299 TaxID=2777974 RepID=A0ABR9U1D1_9NOSO|nr:hypothetical protein [Nostoc edaphicum]MBE9106115.1 hypothetical protein [Nostoc cf. edaphicum LEGE 07299]
MNANNGIISQYIETIDRLEAIFQAKSITIFARIDQLEALPKSWRDYFRR